MQSFNNFLVDNYSLIKAFHVISMVAWMAALLYLPRLFVYHTTAKKNSDTSEMLKIMEYRLQKYIMTPAMLSTLLFGILLLKTNGIVNWGEKWIYFKLLAVFLLLLVHHLLTKYRKDFLLEWVLNHPKGSVLNGYSHHIWNGVTTLQFAKICKAVIENDKGDSKE